ncbi:MAG: flavodoxin [Longicatena sp.]
MSKKAIVVYFTSSLHTETVSKYIAEITGSDLCEIKPVVPYTTQYSSLVKQASEEIKNGIKPEIEKMPFDINSYDTIYVGSPNWCGTVVPVVSTFLTKYDFTDKIILPFITHGGGGMGHADKTIQELCPSAHVKEVLQIQGDGGKMLRGSVMGWLENVGETHL